MEPSRCDGSCVCETIQVCLTWCYSIIHFFPIMISYWFGDLLWYGETKRWKHQMTFCAKAPPQEEKKKMALRYKPRHLLRPPIANFDQNWPLEDNSSECSGTFSGVVFVRPLGWSVSVVLRRAPNASIAQVVSR